MKRGSHDSGCLSWGETLVRARQNGTAPVRIAITSASSAGAGQCLRRVVIEQSQAGSKNPIIIGLACGTIDLSDPAVRWVTLLLDERMRSLAEVPLEDGLPRGPPEEILIPC